MCHYSSCQYLTVSCLHLQRLYCYQELQSYFFISLYSYNYIISLPLNHWSQLWAKFVHCQFDHALFQIIHFLFLVNHKCRDLEKIQIDIHLLNMTLLLIFRQKIKQIKHLKHLKYYYKFMKINLAHTIHKFLIN